MIMKKGILFALAALCVSVVQAVTIDWTTDSSKVEGGSTFVSGGFKDSDGNNVTVSGSFKIVMDFSASARPDGHANFIQLLQTNPDAKGELRFNLNGNNTNGAAEFGMYDGNGANWYKPTENNNLFTNDRVISDTQSNTLTLIFNYDEATSKYTGGTYAIKFANGYEYNGVLGWPELDLPHGDNGFGEGGATWTTLKLASGVTMNSMSLTVVPEPTALALLALGVAGLALRRKA